MASIENVGLVFSSPGKVARSISDRPDWKTPLAVVVIVMILFTLVIFPYQAAYQRQMLEKLQKDTGREMNLDQLTKPTLAKRVFGLVGIAVTTVLFALITAAILNGISMVVGKSAGFARTFTLVSYGMIVAAAGSLVKIPLILAKKSMDVRISLAAFFPAVRIESPTGILLNSTDVFALWGAAVMAIGFAVLAQIGIKKSIAVVASLYVVFVLLQLGIGVMMTAATGRVSG